MMKKKISNRRFVLSIKKFLPLIIFIITIFMSIGYASINSIIVGFDGKAVAKEVDGIYIIETKYVNDIDADLENSKILSAYQTNLVSDIVLSSTNPNSSITYDITVYNSTNYPYMYDGVDYLIGGNSYSNYNIDFSVSLNKGDIVDASEKVTFSITFNYKNNELYEINKLTSLLKFKFILQPYVVDTYDYSGSVETFVAPHEGVYKLEVWGAQGGSHDETYYGGYGGYSSGNIFLEKGQSIYVVVGEQGKSQCVSISCKGGYNGGGDSGVSTSDELNYTSSGGGASHMALTNRGELSNYSNNKSEILIVAGGGGGGYYHTGGVNVSNFGGAGGGLSGVDGHLAGIQQGSNGIVLNATGGSQTAGGIAGYRGANGSFGQGGSGVSCNSDKCGSSGGGGGYYGGGAAGHAGTGGGSGYIGGVIEGVTIAGTNSIPNYDDSSTTIGNSGNGYAKITFLREIEEGSVYISNVKYVGDNNADLINSKIIGVNKTELSSDISLSNNPTSSLTYEVEIFNTTNFSYYYDDTYYDNIESVYTNENIIFELDGLETGYILKPKSSIKFNVTFHYDDVINISSTNLLSVLEFKFIKTYNIAYIGFNNYNYPSFSLENKSFNLTFNDVFSNIKIKSGDNYLDSSEYSFDGINLVINKVVDDITVINVDNVQIIPDFSFSNSIYTITMGGYNVYRVNSSHSLQVKLDLNGMYDLSNMLFVEFDLFIPNGYNPKNLIGVQSQLELSSSGHEDVEELTYGIGENFYNDLIPGFWNHVVIPLNQFNNDEGDGYDISKINYIGLYWNNEKSDITYTIPNCEIKNFKFSNYIL